MAKLHKDPLNERLRDIDRADNKSVSEDISAAEARARMISRIYHKDDDDDVEWITVNGTHVPLKDGKAIGGPFKGKTFENSESKQPNSNEQKCNKKAKSLTSENQSAKIKESTRLTPRDHARLQHKIMDARAGRLHVEKRKNGNTFFYLHQMFDDDVPKLVICSSKSKGYKILSVFEFDSDDEMFDFAARLRRK